MEHLEHLEIKIKIRGIAYEYTFISLRLVCENVRERGGGSKREGVWVCV